MMDQKIREWRRQELTGSDRFAFRHKKRLSTAPKVKSEKQKFGFFFRATEEKAKFVRKNWWKITNDNGFDLEICAKSLAAAYGEFYMGIWGLRVSRCPECGKNTTLDTGEPCALCHGASADDLAKFIFVVKSKGFNDFYAHRLGVLIHSCHFEGHLLKNFPEFF